MKTQAEANADPRVHEAMLHVLDAYIKFTTYSEIKRSLKTFTRGRRRLEHALWGELDFAAYVRECIVAGKEDEL